MENYIVDDYIKSTSSEKVKRKRKVNILREKALALWDKDISAKEIAEVLELNDIQLQEVLGKQRIKKGYKSANSTNREKLTSSRVNRIANSRDKRIIELSKTMNMENIAKILNMSIELLKERYLALGLQIYTDEQIKKMREETQNLEENKEKKQNRIKNEKEKKQKAGSVVEEKEERPQEEEIDFNNFDEIKRKIRENIVGNNIKMASKIAKRALEEGNLGIKEKGKLEELVYIIENVKKRNPRNHHSQENESR